MALTHTQKTCIADALAEAIHCHAEAKHAILMSIDCMAGLDRSRYRLDIQPDGEIRVTFCAASDGGVPLNPTEPASNTLGSDPPPTLPNRTVDGTQRLYEPPIGLTPADGDMAERAEALLHPTGRCTCHGEGECEWCRGIQAQLDAEGHVPSDEPLTDLTAVQVNLLRSEHAQLSADLKQVNKMLDASESYVLKLKADLERASDLLEKLGVDIGDGMNVWSMASNFELEHLPRVVKLAWPRTTPGCSVLQQVAHMLALLPVAEQGSYDRGQELRKLKAAAELKVWGECKPRDGSTWLAYLSYVATPVLMRWDESSREHGSVCQSVLINLTVEGDSESCPCPAKDTRWCYVPEPPNWDEVSDGTK